MNYIKKYQDHILLGLFCFILGGLYLKPFFFEVGVNLDAPIVINPLREVHSFQQYVHLIINGKLADFQPLRDLSFFLSFPIEEIFSKIHYFFNFSLFMGLIFSLFLYFRNVSQSFQVSLLMTSIFSFHPILAQTVPWIVARKHLMAIFFIILAQIEMQKETVGLLRSSVLYLCSVLSQPIVLLWPMNGFLREKMRFSELKKWVPLLIIMLLIGLANYLYYSIYFHKLSQTNKIFEYGGLGPIILALGRNFIQLCLPFKMAFAYDPGSILNILGIPLLVGWHALIIKYVPRSKFLTIMGLFWPTQILTNFVPTNIFVSDTYLILPLVSVILSFYFLTREFSFDKYKMVFLILPMLLMIKTYSTIEKWRDLKTYWQDSYEQEDSCINLLWYTKEKWVANEYEDAIILSKKIFSRGCYYKGVEYENLVFNIFLSRVVFDKDLTIEQKKIQIEKLPIQPKLKLFLEKLIDLDFDQEQKVIDVIMLAKELGLKKGNTLLNRVQIFCEGKLANQACQDFNQP